MFLGIDLGKKTTGLAISSGTIAQPLKTITHNNLAESVAKISQIADEEKIEKVIVGYVEGKIKPYFQMFAKLLKVKNPNLEIILWDETLTSRHATETMIKLQIPKLKRQKRQHEIAAALILQSYLDS